MAEQKVNIVSEDCLTVEYPIGATISIEGINCKVVKDIDTSDENCYECILNNKLDGISCRNLACLSRERKDKKGVHFVKIESHE